MHECVVDIVKSRYAECSASLLRTALGNGPQPHAAILDKAAAFAETFTTLVMLRTHARTLRFHPQPLRSMGGMRKSKRPAPPSSDPLKHFSRDGPVVRLLALVIYRPAIILAALYIGVRQGWW